MVASGWQRSAGDVVPKETAIFDPFPVAEEQFVVPAKKLPACCQRLEPFGNGAQEKQALSLKGALIPSN